ncbi:AAA family ATPase [Methanomethylophilus alvi]|uniref:AAA family ATPase n=1 Tax=Methanomethylophilus alvi TaxID=1291540 RepID=UPI0037DCE09B
MEDVKLKRVKICGFKSIKESTIDLHNINILIGPNGSGKSNFISALYFLQNILDKKLQEVVGKAGLPSLLYGGVKTTKEIGMEFFFNQNSYGFKLVPNDAGNLVFSRECYGWNDGHWSVPRTPYGYESEFEKGVRNNIEPYVKPVLEAKKWRVYHFHDTTSTAGMKQVGMLSDTVSLQHDASNLAPFLYMLKQSYPESYDDILCVVKMVAPYFSDFVLEPNAENNEIIRLRWKQVGQDEVFGVNQLSDGTLRFICLATLLLQPSELQPTTIILDEPELGLHPHAIAVFAELVHMVSSKKQLIISTQSTDLLDKFDADDVIVAELTSEGSKYVHLSSEKLKEWLDEYALSTVWKMNIFGGQP